MDIEKVVSELTLEEKVSLLAGKNFWETTDVERLGIPSVVLTDGPHGLRLSDGMDISNTKPATVFPIEAAMASTFNSDLIRSAGQAMAEECQHYGVSVLLGPGLNGKRSPLGGRNFEYFSEDPFLSGKMGAALVSGIQSGGVSATIKHFVANEQETNRMTTSSEVDERALREIYLKPFEMVVREAKPWAVMCSYNKLNGVQMAQNSKYLLDVLRGEWGYDGVVMSDWGAAVDKVESVKGGLDLEMPGPGLRNQRVLDAVKEGRVSEEEINERVRNFLRLLNRVIAGRKESQACEFEAHDEIAGRVAEEACVLLKNEDHFLPLKEKTNVAVIGEFAEHPRFQGGGSSHMNPYKLSIPLEEIKKFANVTYCAGYGKDRDPELLAKAVQIAKSSEAVIIFAGTTEIIESEGYDRESICLPDCQLELIQKLHEVNKNVVVVTNSGSALAFAELDHYSRAMLHAWLQGQAGGRAIAEILFGKVNPSGKLSETFPVSLESTPSYLNFPGDIRQVKYTESVFTGYRYYDTTKAEVMYPFGFGLSYTSFEYSDLRISKTELKNGETVEVSFNVKNTGEISGMEAVQVYVHDVQSALKRPEKELKGFSKVSLLPGEEKRVTVTLDDSAFAYYVPHMGAFAVESGEFEILVGASSRDIRLKGSVNFNSSVMVRESPTLLHDVKYWMEDERTKPAINMLLQMMKMDESNPMHAIFMGMPVFKVIWFIGTMGASQEQVLQICGVLGIDFAEAKELNEK